MPERVLPTTLLMAFAVLLAPDSSPGQTTDAARTAEAPARRLTEKETNAAVRTYLETTMVTVDFDAIALEEVFAYFADAYEINLQANWPALEAVAIERDIEVNITLKQVPLEVALNAVLEQVGAGETELAYDIDYGVLTVSTREDLARRTLLRVYAVRDLITSGYGLRRFANTPVLRLEPVGGESVGLDPKLENQKTHTVNEGRSGGMSGFDERTPEQREADLEEYKDRIAIDIIKPDDLIHMIHSIIDPESWRLNGGNIGAIWWNNGALVVTQTTTAHTQLVDLLEQLRDSRPALLRGRAWIVRMPARRAMQWSDSLDGTLPELSRKQLSDLLAADDVKPLFHAVTSGFDGDRMWFSTLKQTGVISSVTPVLGHGVWGASIVPAPVTSGLELIVVPRLQPESDRIELDVQMAWMPPPEFKTTSATIGSTGDPANGASTQLTLPGRPLRTVSTTTRVAGGLALALTIPNDVDQPLDFQDWLILHVRPARPAHEQGNAPPP